MYINMYKVDDRQVDPCLLSTQKTGASIDYVITFFITVRDLNIGMCN